MTQRIDKKLNAIVFLRALASLMVCFLHFSQNENMKYPADNFLLSMLDKGRYGVDIFFVISGFILPYSMHQNGYNIKSFFRYLGKRMVRIEPPYLFSIVLVVILLYLSTYSKFYRGKGLDFDWVDIPLHIGYLSPYFNRYFILPVYWTLQMEFQFYILLGILYYFIVNDKAEISLISICIMLFICWSEIFSQTIFGRISVFCVGISTFQFYRGVFLKKHFMLLLILLFIFTFYKHDIYTSIFSLISALVILNFNYSSPVIDFFGKISYSLYLLHWPIGNRILNLFSRLSTGILSVFLFNIIAISVTILFSWLYYRVIEVPSIRLSKKINYK